MSTEQNPDWARLAAPSLAAFEDMAQVAYENLPADFKTACEGLVVRVEDFPDDEVLDEMQCESEFDLLGLFKGRGLAQASAFGVSGEMPNMIWLYRRPILDYWAEHEDTLGAIVTHVMVHEIGHHLGFSDEDMEAVEKGA